MPLLMCPNDNVSMNTINRQGVEFDMCPQCRGVWLDRGELEKILSSTVDEQAGGGAPRPAAPAPPQPYAPPQQPWGGSPQPRAPSYGYGERGESGERGYDQHGRPRRKRGLDIFDIFD